MKKRILSILLALVMVVSLLPVTAFADGDSVTSWSALQEAINATPGDATTPATEPTTIQLTQDLTAPETGGASITIPEGKNIILDLNGKVLDAKGKFSVITVGSGANLTLSDSGSTEHYFTVGANGLWTLTDTKTETTKTVTGGVITGGNGGTAGSGGVRVSGTLNMNAGNIVGNEVESSGGGVYVSEGGSFTMNGGSIAGNIAWSGAGVYISSTFTMSGGSICDNTATFGGGVCVGTSKATFTMSDGSICDNTAPTGGGVYASGKFNMDGGNIAKNTANEGGGVYNKDNFKMSGGSICDNTASTGGGVYQYSYSITLGGTAQITDNTKDTGTGGSAAANNVYLPSERKVTLGTKTASSDGNGVAAPASDFVVGITTETKPTESSPVKITNTCTADDVGYFTSDSTDYEVKFNTNHLELAVAPSTPIFDPCNGADVIESKTAPETDPTWGDYVFAGWYSAPVGGDEIKSGFVEGTTYYAHWTNAEGNTVLTEGITVKADGVYIGSSDTAATDTELASYGLAFDKDTAKLTITDVTIESPDYIGLENTVDDLVIEVKGTNYITANGFNFVDLGYGNEQWQNYALYSNDHAMKITGSGELTVKGGDVTKDISTEASYPQYISYGVKGPWQNGKVITIDMDKAGKLNAIGSNITTNIGGSSTGFSGDLKMLSGTLTATGGNVTAGENRSRRSCGLYSENKPTISGGRIVASAGTITPASDNNRCAVEFHGGISAETLAAATITGTTVPDNYANYCKLAQTGTAPVVISMGPAFDPCNGDGIFSAETPTNPTWTGYTFDGWYTARTGGTLVHDGTEFKNGFTEFVSGTTYYAHWTNAAGKTVLTEGITVKADGVHIGSSETVATNDQLEKYGLEFAAATDSAPATLSMNGVTIEAGGGVDTKATSAGSKIYTGLFSNNNLNLELTGENTIRITRKSDSPSAVFVRGSLTATGSGSLIADADSAEGITACGLCVEGKLTNSGTIIGRAGKGQYVDGVSVINGLTEITGGKVVGYGGTGTDEYYGFWTNDSITVSGTGVLELHGGAKTGTDSKEALYLAPGKTITITDNGKIVADSTVKNDGKYADYYTVTGANTDIASKSAGSTLTMAGDANIEIFAKEYTVSFKANGGTPAPSAQSTMAYVTEPDAMTKSGYAFAGWYRDAAFTQAWDFDNDYVRANTTLYAKWVQESAVSTVSGTVENESDAPVDEADVSLMRGDVTYSRYTTGSDGTFSFSNVPAGEYQLVVTDGTNTTTTLVTVASDGTVTGGGEITLYTTSKTSSVVEITGNDTPDIMVGGLAEVAYANKDNGGASVTVTLEVEKLPENAVNSDDKTKIEAAADDAQTLDYIDMTLLLKVGTATPVPIADTEGTLLEVVIPYDLSGKTNIALYRQHGNEPAALKLPEGEASAIDGEYVVIDKADNLIRAHLRYFSTYAIGYEEEKSSGGGGGGSSYAIELPENVKNGKVDVSPKTASAGQTVTITVTPDKGFTLETLTVLDKNGKEIEVRDLGDGKYSFTMPNGAVSVEAVFAQLPGYASCLGDDACPLSKFTDVDVTAWYHDGIHFCLDEGLMVGVADTKFDPAGDVTRGMIVTMLWRLEGKPYVNYAMSFTDVPAEQWYTEAIRWAASEKIVSGYDAERFGPNDPVTREQLATILYNYAKSKGQGFTGSWMFLLDFADRADISAWADEAVHWCSMKGVVSGKDGKVFDPQGTATRAEAASMIQRFCEALEK